VILIEPTVTVMPTFVRLLILILIGSSLAVRADGLRDNKQAQDSSRDQLELKLKVQYAAIEKIIANPPNPADSPTLVRVPGQPPYDVADYKRRIREWQDDLAQSFKTAEDIVSEILKSNPPDPAFWRERLETLDLYAQPVSSPETRTVYGVREVEKSAQLLDLPLAVYTNEARAAHARGDVRLRLVLAADGKIKYIFPLKSLRYGLTESAMAAANQIKFEPAIRNGKPASQFLTLVYEFEKGQARKPYVPRTEF